MQDAKKGFATSPLKWSELLKITKGRPFRLTPRCIIVQSSGKKRIIDNADAGGQSERSADLNKLVLCSALRPAQQAAAVAERMGAEAWARRIGVNQFKSGGEDWPEAESLGCVVSWWHQELQAPVFQVYSSLLFGLPLAVTSFNRYSRLVESLGRRLVATLVSMCFDDANVVDWQSARGSGNKLLGTPFAEEKRQPMASEGTFPNP